MSDTDDFDPLATARRILRTAASGALATLDAQNGVPFPSLVAVASDFDGTPVLLLSDLALHTRNLKADARAGLLLEAPEFPVPGVSRAPLQASRLSLEGVIEPCAGEQAVQRFFSRHADARGYAGFADFRFYRLVPRSGHLVAGFGRIHTIEGEDLLADVSGSEALAAAETRIVEHMNQDHGDALLLYAARLIGPDAADREGPWRMTGCDPHGIDMRGGAGDRDLRLDFEEPVSDAASMRAMLVALVKQAREK